MKRELAQKFTVEVSILGQRYFLKGKDSPEYMKTLAGFVDSKMREILKESPNMPPLKAAILACLNISDELFKLKQKEKVVIDYINEKAKMLDFIFSDE